MERNQEDRSVIEPAQDQHVERRVATHRRRVLRGAIVFYAENKITARCMIRDLTPYGAQLKILQDIPVPDKAVLFFETGEMRVSFQAAWRNGKLMGVKFDEPCFELDAEIELGGSITMRTQRLNSLVRH